MPNPRKTQGEDIGFFEDFRFDLGFVLTMMESMEPRHAEAAIVEMADIVRRRLETLAGRSEPDVVSVAEAAVALVMVERMLTVWKQRIGEFIDPVVDDALRFATETIDRLDPPSSGRMPLREQVGIAARQRAGSFEQIFFQPL